MALATCESSSITLLSCPPSEPRFDLCPPQLVPAATDLLRITGGQPLQLSSWEFSIGWVHKFFSSAGAHGSLLPPWTPFMNQLQLPDPPSSCPRSPCPLHDRSHRAWVGFPLPTSTVHHHVAPGTVFWVFSFSALYRNHRNTVIFSDSLPYPALPPHLCVPLLQASPPTWTWGIDAPGQNPVPIPEAYLINLSKNVALFYDIKYFIHNHTE